MRIFNRIKNNNHEFILEKSEKLIFQYKLLKCILKFFEKYLKLLEVLKFENKK